MEDNNELKDLYTPISTENSEDEDNSEELARQRKKGVRLFLIIFFTTVIAITAVIITGYSMITDRANANKFNEKASTEIVTPLAKSIALGEEAEITDKMINGLLTYCVNTYNKENKKSGSSLSVQGIAVNLHENKPADIYMKVSYYGIEAIVNAKTDITLDEKNEKIKLTIKEAYLGSMPVEPTYLVQYALSKEDLHKYIDEINDSIDLSGNTVTLPASYSFEIYDIPLEIKITQLELKEKSAVVNTTGIIDSIGDLLSKIISGN